MSLCHQSLVYYRINTVNIKLSLEIFIQCLEVHLDYKLLIWIMSFLFIL